MRHEEGEQNGCKQVLRKENGKGKKVQEGKQMDASEYIEMRRRRIRMLKKEKECSEKLANAGEESEQPASKESELEE